MMLPATTSCPPNFFTPRRRPAESRPLREEPPAFLCAISNYSLRLGCRGFALGRNRCRISLLRLRLLLLSTDRGDLQDRVLLAMAVLAVLIVAALLLDAD